MKALLTLISATLRKTSYVAAFLPMILFIFPQAAVHADNGQALVFEVKQTENPNFSEISQTQTSISLEDIMAADPLVEEVLNFLKSKGSPLADRDTVIKMLQNTQILGDGTPVWRRALAISWVESNMCKRTPKSVITKNKRVIRESYNCSGMNNGKRVYNSYAEWFEDMTKLLLKPTYINRPIPKYIGFYVIPGSNGWKVGVQKIEKDLASLDARATEQRIAKANSHLNIALTNVELAVK